MAEKAVLLQQTLAGTIYLLSGFHDCSWELYQSRSGQVRCGGVLSVSVGEGWYFIYDCLCTPAPAQPSPAQHHWYPHNLSRIWRQPRTGLGLTSRYLSRINFNLGPQEDFKWTSSRISTEVSVLWCGDGVSLMWSVLSSWQIFSPGRCCQLCLYLSVGVKDCGIPPMMMKKSKK